MSDEPLTSEAFVPLDPIECHELILRLRSELAETRRRLAVHEQNQRREFERMYAKGVAPQSLLGIGLLVSGNGTLPDKPSEDPTCGEIYLRAKAAEKATRRKKKK